MKSMWCTCDVTITSCRLHRVQKQETSRDQAALMHWWWKAHQLIMNDFITKNTFYTFSFYDLGTRFVWHDTFSEGLNLWWCQMSKETFKTILNSINYHTRVADADMQQQPSANRCVHFTVPMRAVQRWSRSIIIYRAHSCRQRWPLFEYVAEIKHVIKNTLTVGALHSYLLPDIRTMSQGRTATKNKHRPPDLLHLSSSSHSLRVTLFMSSMCVKLEKKHRQSCFIYLCY